MILSIVTGTFNRLASLIRMVESARDDIPHGISYEFVIVDGGSTDGTIQWCTAQPDIVLIQHGELSGAIRAFDDGANAATGDYVVMANDDITFEPGSIVRAIVYLEQHTECGGVAFMDDRLFNVGETIRFKAQLQPALNADGEGTKVIYAQVGMFRRWLGNVCGWWGSQDEIMRTARTYGGDNYLSSRIWEAGYTVDICAGVNVADHHLRVKDALRQINQDAKDHAYWDRFPRGPVIGSAPIDAPTLIGERLRILYMPIFEPGFLRHRETKRGLFNALSTHGIVWEWDYLNEQIDISLIGAFAPHLIITQFHDARWGNLIASLRKLAPDARIINWNGDARGLTDDDYLAMLHKVDVQLVVNAAALPVYARESIPAAYWQIGYEESGDELPAVPAHDVVFLGNCYNDARRDLEKTLLDSGLDVGFYGQLWQKSDGDTLYDFAAGAALYRNAKIAVGDTFTDGGKTPTKAFVSNRLFQALAAGAFMLQQHSDSLEQYTGLKDGVHYVQWRTTDDLVATIKRYLPKTKERRKIAEAGQAFVLEHYSFDAQVQRLFTEILPTLEGVYDAVTA